jgi:hypothetical protein
MKKIISIPLIALLISSCATKPSKQAYDYLNDPPVKFGQSVHYTLNAPVLVMDGEEGFGIEYETNAERFLPFNGANIDLRKFIIESPNSHVHLKCENESTTPFDIDGHKYILDLRSEFDDSTEDILTVWREQDFRDQVEAEQRALGIAAHKMIQQQKNKE